MLYTLVSKCVMAGAVLSVCQIVQDAALKYKIPPTLFHAIVRVESSYRVKAVNPKQPGVAITSYGLGQLTLDTAMAHCNLTKAKILDAKKNAECAAKVLAYQLKRYGGDRILAIAAYNSGTAFLATDGQPKNSDYVGLVLSQLGEIGPVPDPSPIPGL